MASQSKVLEQKISDIHVLPRKSVCLLPVVDTALIKI